MGSIMMGLLWIWIFYSLAEGWGCLYPVMLGWGTPAEPSQAGEALSACWVHCCVCIHRWPAAQLRPAQQLVTLFLQQWAVTWADVSQELRVPSLSQDSSGPRAQDKPAGADAWPLAPQQATQALWLPPIPHAQCAQHTKVCSALQGPFALCVFRCVVPFRWSAFTSPPLLPGKGGAGGACLLHLVLCHHGSSLWLPARMVL